ncbi:MAG TPA: homocysteine S-methyltransferase family protein [Anaerolineae bacterium]|nr:homocysteine S-methyltransferase family protein [Anaerolineae bacterium]
MLSFLDRLAQNKPILLDGATGTELNRRNIDTSLPLWSARALIEYPDAVRSIHADYILAGADMITTNTFRTHRRTLDRAGQFNTGPTAWRSAGRARGLTQLAVQLAREAISRSGRSIFIAGSMSPLEDCYSPQLVPPDDELRVEHQEMARDLADAGCDVLLIETMNTIREAVIATEAALATGLPVGVSFVVGPGGRPPDDPNALHNHEAMTLLSGESIDDAVIAVSYLKPNVILINCVPFNVIDRAFDLLRAASDRPIGLYANVGHTDAEVGWALTDDVEPEAYARRARDWIDRGAKIVGGCCGTTPKHIAAIKKIM